MKSLSLTAPAKLNLFLHITGRRDDGYHDLQTLFQLLDYGDQLDICVRDDGVINVHCDLPGLSMQDNLIYKAARALQTHGNIAQGAEITVQKHIPSGGGLGGGSSNAASTLLGLNALWQCQLSEQQLADIGLSLGADVPVFVRGRSAWAEGVGECIHPVSLPRVWYLILRPKCHISTAQVFSHERLTRDTPKTTIAPALDGRLYTTLRNDCEPVARALYGEVAAALDWLNTQGIGRLTGTGACCFCAFDSKQAAQASLSKAQQHFDGFIAKGINTSPTLEQLEYQLAQQPS